MAPSFRFPGRHTPETITDQAQLAAQQSGSMAVHHEVDSLAIAEHSSIFTMERFRNGIFMTTAMMDDESVDLFTGRLVESIAQSQILENEIHAIRNIRKPGLAPKVNSPEVSRLIYDVDKIYNTNAGSVLDTLANTAQCARIVEHSGSLPHNYANGVTRNGYQLKRTGRLFKGQFGTREFTGLSTYKGVEDPGVLTGKTTMAFAHEIDRLLVTAAAAAMYDQRGALNYTYKLENYADDMLSKLRKASEAAALDRTYDTAGGEIVQNLQQKLEQIRQGKASRQMQPALYRIAELVDAWATSRPKVQEILRPVGIMQPPVVEQKEVSKRKYDAATGFRLPDFIIPAEPVTQIETLSETDSNRDETIEKLLHDHKSLEESYQAFMVPLVPSAKQLKAGGLYDLMRDMRIGFGMATEHVEGVEKDRAQWMLGVLHGLEQLLSQSQGDTSRRQQLEEYLSSESTYLAQIKDVRERLKELGVNGFDALEPRIVQSAEWFGDNYDGFKALLLQKTPDIAEKYGSILRLFNTNPEIDMTDETPDFITLDEPSLPQQPEAVLLPLDEPTLFVEDSPLLLRDVAEVAKQLDWAVLPPAHELSVERIKKELNGSLEEFAKIDWKRIEDLIQLTQTFEGIMYRSKPGTLAALPPYFVAELQVNGRIFAVAENAVEGNATYVVADHLADGDWREVLAEAKRDARIFGARKIVHPTTERVASGRQLDRILTVMQDMALTLPTR
jgi:hypothetical protein